MYTTKDRGIVHSLQLQRMQRRGLHVSDVEANKKRSKNKRHDMAGVKRLIDYLSIEPEPSSVNGWVIHKLETLLPSFPHESRL